MTDDVLTFEELRRAQHQERDMDTLQDLDDNFLERAKNYLEMKRDPDSHLENQEYRNAKHILEDLLDMRQKKIVRLAFLAHKSNVNAENLLPGEETLFTETKAAIGSYRDSIHEDLFTDGAVAKPDTGGEHETSDTGSAPDAADDAEAAASAVAEADDGADDGKADEPDDDTISDDAAEDADAASANDDTAEADGAAADDRSADADGDEETDTIFGDADEKDSDDGDEAVDDDDSDTIFGGDDADRDEEEPSINDSERDDADDAAEDDTDDGRVAVVVTQEVPEFMGVDLNAYGPYEEGDEARVPEKNADVLVEQGKAERPG